MVFSSEEQKAHRNTFIHDCRQKAWFEGEIKTLETAVDAPWPPW
jgi:hypothetical protein